MRLLSIDPSILTVDEDKEPGLDRGICSVCGWDGFLSDCEVGQEGDWESGYVDIPLCPICGINEEEGCIADYYMSDKRCEEWYKWLERRKKA